MATLDAVFQSVMTAQHIRAASVAIASGRTIYAKRAYTWAEPGNVVTTTTTTFRLASVSKLFTAAAVQRLADEGVIDLDASVFGYLGLVRSRTARHAQGRHHDRAVRDEPERTPPRLRDCRHEAA